MICNAIGLDYVMRHSVHSDMGLLKVIMTRFHFDFSITDCLLFKLTLISIHFHLPERNKTITIFFIGQYEI